MLQDTVITELPSINVKALRTALRGEVITPRDRAYDTARQVWNARVDAYPAYIVRCAHAADVAVALRFARTHDIDVAVRAGGHSGFGVANDALVVDLGPMKGIEIDAAAGTVRAEAGVLAGELTRAAQEHGLAVPVGQISSVGIAGLTLGGGIGWLVRKHGLTIDNLLEVEIVTADGRALVANDLEHAELFWAVRGGGGNFGVVTAFTYRAHPLGPLVYGGPLVYTLDRAAEALRCYREVMAGAPDELSASAILMTVPPAPHFPAHLHGRQALAIDLCYAGRVEDGPTAIQPLRDGVAPDFDAAGPLPYLVRQSMHDAAGAPGIHHDVASSYLRDLSDAAIETLVAHFRTVPSSMTVIQVPRLGGAMARVAPDATAYSHRAAPYLLWVTPGWKPGEDVAPLLQWRRQLMAALEPFATGGSYVNAIGNEGAAGVHAAYPAGTFERLQAVKEHYDPENSFRLNQNVPPASRYRFDL